MSNERRSKVVIERTYRASIEDVWDLWTTKEGFESWWGPQGFRSEVQELEAREGGALRYRMIADTPEMIAEMNKMGMRPSHAVRCRFTEVRRFERLALASVIDFFPGVEAYESQVDVDFFTAGDGVRMVITLHAMHSEEFTKMAEEGFTSQLTKVDQRFARLGRMVYWMNVSMDLRIEHAPNEQGGGTWMRIGEELHREFNARAARLALSVEGRVIYETMEAYWPKAAGDESLPSFMRDYGRIWTAAPKVLVSNTRRTAGHNTRILGGPDALDQLAKLRRDTDGDIGVGGATLASQLMRRGLLDELLLFVHPVILGSGRPLFDDGVGLVQCELLEHATFAGGVAMHRYAIRH